MKGIFLNAPLVEKSPPLICTYINPIDLRNTTNFNFKLIIINEKICENGILILNAKTCISFLKMFFKIGKKTFLMCLFIYFLFIGISLCLLIKWQKKVKAFSRGIFVYRNLKI